MTSWDAGSLGYIVMVWLAAVVLFILWVIFIGD